MCDHPFGHIHNQSTSHARVDILIQEARSPVRVCVCVLCVSVCSCASGSASSVRTASPTPSSTLFFSQPALHNSAATSTSFFSQLEVQPLHRHAASWTAASSTPIYSHLYVALPPAGAASSTSSERAYCCGCGTGVVPVLLSAWAWRLPCARPTLCGRGAAMRAGSTCVSLELPCAWRRRGPATCAAFTAQRGGGRRRVRGQPASVRGCVCDVRMVHSVGVELPCVCPFQ